MHHIFSSRYAYDYFLDNRLLDFTEIHCIAYFFSKAKIVASCFITSYNYYRDQKSMCTVSCLILQGCPRHLFPPCTYRCALLDIAKWIKFKTSQNFGSSYKSHLLFISFLADICTKSHQYRSKIGLAIILLY